MTTTGKLIAWLGAGLACAAPLLALDPTQKADGYSIQGWFTEDGLHSNKIRSVIQARDGYLWLATAQGLVRFDGSQFTDFNAVTHPELGRGAFFAALEAPDGALWFGGELGLVRWQKGRFDRFTTQDGLAHNHVRGLALTRDGAVVACTRLGYSFVRDGRITTPGGIWQEVRGTARSYLERADGSLLLGTAVGLWQITGDKIQKLSGTADLPGNAFISLLETPDGSAWIGHSAGLRCLRADGRVEDYGRLQGLTSPRVAALRQDRDGNLWIAASGSLYRMAQGRIELAGYHGHLKGTPINHLQEDREGGLWIATLTGLFRLKDTVCSSISVDEGLAYTSAHTVFEAPNGAWWIGLWDGGVYRYDQSGAVRVPGLSALDLERVYSFAAEPDNTLWIGSESGLYRFSDGKLTNLYQHERAAEWLKRLATQRDALLPGLAHHWVKSVATDAAGGIWAATEGAVYHGVAGQFRAYTAADGLIGDEFESVICTRNGDVWVSAGKDGVSRWHGGKWTSYRCGEALPVSRPLGLYEDSAGTIWARTHGGGLVRFQDGKWRTYTTRDGLAHDFISSIIEDKLGNLWIAYPRGIMRIPRREFDELDTGRRASLQPRIFNSSDGLPRSDVNPFGTPNVWRSQDGRLLFATDLGVAVLDPGKVKINELKPPIHIERLVVNGKEAGLSRRVSLAPNLNSLEIHYTAISLLAPEKIRFQIRLAPLDRTWVDNGTRRAVHYAKLPAGDYTFRVKACNNDGVWSEEAVRLRFTVRPSFYKTPWFFSLVGLMAVVTGFGIHRSRRRRARRQMAVLSDLVAARTSELQAAKDAAEAAVLARNDSITALRQAQEEVAAERARFKFIFESMPVGIALLVPGDNEHFFANPAHERITGLAVSEMPLPGAFERVTHPDDLARQRSLTRSYKSGEIDHFTIEKRYVRPSGEIVWASLTRRRYTDPATGLKQSISTLVDITDRKQAELELSRTHSELLEVSRQAGMAEVATGVLHNVGNVLNSVNVSATLVIDAVRNSKVANLAKISAMLQACGDDAGHFLSHDPKGRRIPHYLITLAADVAAERQTLAEELGHLRKNIDHIKDIVAMQQSYAKISGVAETVTLSELVEDALRMNATALARHGMEVVREFEPNLSVTLERHKVLQVLVNLIRNAKHACDATGRTGKRMIVRVEHDAARIRVSVSDNGIGIAPENLTRVFAHGFTTKKNGHGFGLHSGALVARELGGSLTAASEGPGLGSTFTLELPFTPEAPAA